MKIVLLTNILSPYRKTFYDKLYFGFKANGDDFHVLVMAPSEPGRKWTYEMYKGEYTTLLPHRTIHIGSYYIHVNSGLKNIIKEIEPDIVIGAGSYTFPSVWEVILLRKSMSYKLLFWSESHLDEQRKQEKIVLSIRNKIRSIIYSRFDGFWYAGEKSLDLIKQYCREDCNYIFVPNLVDKEAFSSAGSIPKSVRDEISQKLNLSASKIKFIIPSRLIEVKGIIPFLNLVKDNSDISKVTILIVGDGNLHDDIIQTASNYNIDVRLLGYKEQDELIKLYSISDVFLLPSLSDANPLTCVEAIWAGLPVFVSKHVGNFPEIVSEGENGYVFDYSDPIRANELFSKLINNTEEWYKNAILTSQEIAKKTYDPDSSVQRIINELKKYYNKGKVIK